MEVNYERIIAYLNDELTAEEIKAVEIFAKDGNKYTYVLKNFKANTSLDDSTFKVDESAADDVIDLR